MALTKESGDSISVEQYQKQHFTSNLMGQQGLQILANMLRSNEREHFAFRETL